MNKYEKEASKELFEVIDKIINWGIEKGINNPREEFKKLYEEALEAHEDFVLYDYNIQVNSEYKEVRPHLKTELGDIGVVWFILCNILNVSPIEALKLAYKKNKDRKGINIKGNFIKEEDLKDLK